MPPTPLLLLLLTIATYAQTSLQDKRDGKIYKTVQIGEQIWMAENLNYDAKSSVCYDNKPENCEKYGRLYNWETAMKSCPKGWHLPSNKEWVTLVGFAGGYISGYSFAGEKLKSKSGWNNGKRKSGDGTDEYGFSALPGGSGNGTDENRFLLGGNYRADGSFANAGNCGFWWSSSEDYRGIAYSRGMFSSNDGAYKNSNYKARLLSVRCIKD